MRIESSGLRVNLFQHPSSIKKSADADTWPWSRGTADNTACKECVTLCLLCRHILLLVLLGSVANTSGWRGAAGWWYGPTYPPPPPITRCTHHLLLPKRCRRPSCANTCNLFHVRCWCCCSSGARTEIDYILHPGLHSFPPGTMVAPVTAETCC